MERLPDDYRSYHLSRKELFLYLAGSGAALFFTGILFFKSVILGLLMTLASWPLKTHYENYLAEKRLRQLEREYRDLLYSLSASISSGRQMPEALREGLESLLLVYGQESLLGRELARMVQSMEGTNTSEETLLADLARRTGHTDVRQLAEVYSVCKNTGGDLERAVAKTAAVLLDRMAMKSQVRTLTAQKKLEACILTAIPFTLILLLNLVSPTYLQGLYDTGGGRLLMALCLAAVYTAWRWSMRLTDISL